MDNNITLPLVEDLKSIVFDFEHGKFTVNDYDIGHCTDISVNYCNGYWKLSFAIGCDNMTLKKKRKLKAQ